MPIHLPFFCSFIDLRVEVSMGVREGAMESETHREAQGGTWRHREAQGDALAQFGRLSVAAPYSRGDGGEEA